MARPQRLDRLWIESAPTGDGDRQPQKLSAFSGVAQVRKGSGWLFPRSGGLIAAVLASGLLTSFIGCDSGPTTGQASGKVIFEGVPYGKAAVVFFSTTTGYGTTSNLASDGTFSLPAKLPIGEYKIYLAPSLAPTTTEDAAPAPVKIDNSTPRRYWSESSTDIVVNVEPGDNHFEIELTR